MNTHHPTRVAIIRERRVKMFALFFLLAGIILSVFLVNNLLVSYLIATVIFYLLSPFVDFLERKGFSRQAATAIPFFAIFIFSTTALYIILPIIGDQLSSLKVDLPKYLDGTKKLLIDVQSRMTSTFSPIYPIDIVELVQPRVISWSTSIIEQIPNQISKSLTVLFLAPFLGYFMLQDGQNISRQIIRIVPNNLFELALNLHHQISEQMGGYIRARLFESIIVGLIIWFGLLIVNFPYALIMALFAAILNLIPYIGPLIGALPALTISLINGDTTASVFWISFIYVFAQIIDTVVVVPFLVAKIVNLHPVTVVLVVIIGGQLLGIIGMLISIPIASAVKVSSFSIYKHLTNFREE